MKRKQPTKIQKNPTLKSPGSAIIPSKTFHETFPVTLEFMEGKDFKRCFFVCKEHCDSYLKRYKLKKGSYKVFDTKPKMKKSSKAIFRIIAKSLGEKSGKTDQEADRVAVVRLIMFLSILITNSFIVANALRHWNNVPGNYIQKVECVNLK